MGEKIVIGPINQGLKNNRLPFVIDNDSFPVLINAYQWRGRVKRKRGTTLLNRLSRYFNSLSTSYNAGATTITLNGSGVGNILTGFSLQVDASLVPTSITITNGASNYVDTDGDGILYLAAVASGTVDYASGSITIAALAGLAVSATFRYHPTLPVMGIEELILGIDDYPGTLAFDTKYSYNIVTTASTTTGLQPIYDVSFYKNPAASVDLPGYVQKTNWTPTTWNGQDYQQFWTVNYQGALWATNGVNVPFSATNVGMQAKAITGVTIGAAGPPAIVNLTIVSHGLSVGDFLFINEIVGVTGINYQTGYVTARVDVNTVTVEFPRAVIAGAYSSGGVAQYLTNRSDTTKDCIRFYDGDPTNGSATTPVLSGVNGWVNFMPPLSTAAYSIADLPAAIYYLVGARMIVPFKDRLLFIGPVVQVFGATPIYLQDTIIYSQNGTPYYTSSFEYEPTSASTDPTFPTIVYYPILLPVNQTGYPSAFFEDQTGFGGFVTAGIDQPINTSSTIEDVLVLGFKTSQSKLIYSGNDIQPFNFYTINSEYGSASTFSAINMDRGVITQGDRGFVITGQTEVKRVDLDIPDQVFEIKLTENGIERLCSQRDFQNEWIYFTYPSDSFIHKFPTQSLFFNYRDNSWAVFRESYTTYGAFKKKTGYIWGTIGEVYPTWGDWSEPWNSGETNLLQPMVVAGNSQGFIVFRDGSTDESVSIAIKSISTNIITSPNHCLNDGDYITISGAQGTVSTQVNGKIFSVSNSTKDIFSLNPPITSATYTGGGLIKRMPVPFIQTKQFPVAWEMSRKTRLGPQQYLLTATNKSQVTLLIYLSQSEEEPFNSSPVVPATHVTNHSLLYSTVLYTCTESANLGLTPANTNLQMISNISPNGLNASSPQKQIWHRINTSLIGDTVQLAITLNDTQMRDTNFVSQSSEIELHGIILDVNPSSLLA